MLKKPRIALFLSLFALLGLLYFWFLIKSRETLLRDDSALGKNDTLNFCGWIPWWEMEEGIDEIIKAPDVYTTISPFIYEINADNKIVRSISDDEYNLLATYSKNKKIIPTITNNFDPDTVSLLINSPQLREKIVDDIADIAKNYDGIEIDFEQLYADDKNAFTVFIQDLSQKLNGNDKILIVTLHAKINDKGDWDGNKAQDWKALSEHADYLRIMAYDYHWSTSEAGPLAPKSWIQDITDYAKQTIPYEKRILALGLYGYDWIKDTDEGTSRTLEEINTLIKMYKINVKYSTAYDSPYFEYIDESENERTVWYEDDMSLNNKINYARNYYSEICFWKIGGITPSMYKIIQNNM